MPNIDVCYGSKSGRRTAHREGRQSLQNRLPMVTGNGASTYPIATNRVSPFGLRSPSLASDGRLAGYVEGISLVSRSALQEREQQIRGAALTASISVFAAALLLYPLMSGLLGQTVALSSRLLESNLSLLRSLGNAIAKRDADTDAHNYRVTCYAVSLAEALGVGKETIAELVLGAFLHDVGKIGIPDQILLKPGRLTSEEFQVMKTHAMLGIEIVAGNPWLAGAEKTIRLPNGFAGDAT